MKNCLPALVYIPKSRRMAGTHGAKAGSSKPMTRAEYLTSTLNPGLTPPHPPPLPHLIHVRTEEVNFRKRKGCETTALHEKDELPSVFTFPTTSHWPRKSERRLINYMFLRTDITKLTALCLLLPHRSEPSSSFATRQTAFLPFQDRRLGIDFILVMSFSFYDQMSRSEGRHHFIKMLYEVTFIVARASLLRTSISEKIPS